MPLTINIDGLTLAHKGSNGTAIATVPDVCKTPSPGGPVPIPYPNIAMSKDLVKGTTTIKVDGGMMAANLGSELMISTGDEPGVAGGVVSSTFIKEATWMLYSFDVMLEGKNACRLTDKLFMNHMNTVCLGGWIQQFLAKGINKAKSLADACKALFELIMEMLDGVNPDGGPQRHWKDRPLNGPNGRFQQNTTGGGLGGDGAPNAPRNRPPVPGYPNGSNNWETHDSEIKKQQDTLQDRIDEFDDDCPPPTRVQRRELERAREGARRPRPTPEEWQGPQWQPAPAQREGLTDSQRRGIVIIAGLALLAIGIAATPVTGGASLAASAAGVLLIVGAAGTSGVGGSSPAEA